jgi:hypothetical protein
MKCPKCGNDMWGCGTFGLMWNCSCGHIEEGSREDQEAFDDFCRKVLEKEKNKEVKNE